MKAKHCFYLLFFTFYFLSCKTAKPVIQQQQPVQATPAPTVAVQNAVATLPALLNDSNLSNAHVGIYIYEPATKKVIDEYQSNKYFIPASTTKIATCYAAMKYLGDSLLGLMYREEGDSTITIEGTGDPTFLHKDFPKQKVFEKLNCYKKIVFDGASFRTNPLGKGWAWDDYDESYMAERSGFPIYGNIVTVSKTDNKKNIIPKFFQSNFRFVEIKRINLKIPKRYSPINKESLIWVYLNEQVKQLPFATSYYSSKELLNDTLHNIDPISYSPPLTSELPKPFSKLYSQPTDSLLKPMMHNSDNFFAEQTLLMVSLNQLGYMGDEQIIDTLLRRDFISLPQKPRWVDGSGLSRYNLFTPQDFIFILNKMKTEFNWNRISTIFPTANEGTLKGYYKNYSNKIFAKTGSVSNNFSINGFIKTNSGKDFIFSVMVNNYNNVSSSAVRLAIEKYLSQVIDNN